MNGQLWVEVVGELIIARIRGEPPWAQRALDEKLGPIHLRRALVVPNSKLAFLAKATIASSTTTWSRP